MNKPTILIVDDELLIRDLLYDFFTNQGWEIATAENGIKALEILENRSFDLMLTDLKMPGLDGMELTNRVKEEHPQLPVVIMTGFPSIDTAVQALRCKVEDYIIKPFNINQLYKTVEKSVKSNT
jgi:DNA-binding NtrC family response regulator